jgi:hypothetical protein
MKAINLSTASPTLADVLGLAGEENVILETAEGRRFLLAEIDDFAEEVEAVQQNEALMHLLNERSKETKTLPLQKVRAQLKGKKSGQRKETRKSEPAP